MAGEIFIAKEETSQEIKTLVDANGNALSSLSTNLETANTNINLIDTKLGTLAKPAIPLLKQDRFVSVGTAGTWVNLLSVTGAGTLHKVLLSGTWTWFTGYKGLRITIDGTVVFQYLFNQSGSSGGGIVPMMGFSTPSELFSYFTMTTIPNAIDLPYVSSGSGNSLVFPFPIFALPRPITFESGIVIDMYGTLSAVESSYLDTCYELAA